MNKKLSFICFLKTVALFVVVLLGTKSESISGIGLGTQIGEWWDTHGANEDKKAFTVNKLNRSFLMIIENKEKAPYIKEAYFLDGECVQIRLVLKDETLSWESFWGAKGLEFMWGANFPDEKIEEIENEKTFVAFWGENGGKMCYGKGENKGVLSFENAKMRFVSDKYLRTLVKSENLKTTSSTDDSLKMTGMKVGNRVKPVFSSEGLLKGYMSDKGVFFDKNMQYEGWMNNK